MSESFSLPNRKEVADLQRQAEEPRELSYKEVADTLFWSFYFSQGHLNLQHYMFAYMASKHPEWILHDEGVFDQLVDAELPRYKNFLSRDKHKQTPDDDVAKAVYEPWGSMRALLREKRDPLLESDRIEEHIRNIIYILLGQEEKFAFWRPGENRPEKGPFRQGMSQLIEYVIQEKPVPGPPIYAEMMGDIREELEKLPGRSSETMRQRFKKIVDAYTMNHQDQPLDLSKCPLFAKWIEAV